jgi:hypothetical protein
VYPGEEAESADAIAPFEGGQASFTPFTVPGHEPDSFERPATYYGHL